MKKIEIPEWAELPLFISSVVLLALAFIFSIPVMCNSWERWDDYWATPHRKAQKEFEYQRTLKSLEKESVK